MPTLKEIKRLMVVGGVLTALGVGCAAPSAPTTPEKTICTPGCVTPRPQPELGGQKLYFKDVLYGAGSETAIFNVAEPLTYNPKAATDLIKFFETIATDERQFKVEIGQMAGNFQVEPRGVDKRVVIINNSQTAVGQPAKAVEDAIGTTLIGQQDHLVSVLTVSPEIDLNNAFAYAMCDAALKTKEIVQDKVMETESAFWKQYLCLSFAEAYRYRVAGREYNTYDPFSQGYYQSTSGESEWSIPSGWPYSKDPAKDFANNLQPYVFNKTTYEQIPNAPVLTRSK